MNENWPRLSPANLMVFGRAEGRGVNAVERGTAGARSTVDVAMLVLALNRNSTRKSSASNGSSSVEAMRAKEQSVLWRNI